MMDEPISVEAGGAEAGYTLALRPGTRLGDRYVVLRLLAGTSDFALTYLAHDSRRDAAVVAKELLPRGLVSRAGAAVRAHSPEAEHEFGRVLRRFTREAELLLDLRHAALPSATDVVADHGTAYLVMPQHDALRLGEYLPTVGGRLTTQAAVEFTSGLLGALETLHAEGILHREVSPQTVHVRPDGTPLLLGPGAWRHVPGRNREPVAGFDPIEQYGGRDVGPWSDVYGAAAVLYYLVTGHAPASAIERAGGAPLRSPGVWAPDVSPPMASAIVRGLTLAPDGRPHSAAELRRHLEDAMAMSAEPTLPRAMAVLPHELLSQGSPTGGAHRDDDSADSRFTLSSFGVVVPRNEGGVERTLKRVADVAARLKRRRAPESEQTAPLADPAPASAGRRLDPVYDADHVRAAEPVVAPQATPRSNQPLEAAADEAPRLEPLPATVAEEEPRMADARAIVAEEEPRVAAPREIVVEEEARVAALLPSVDDESPSLDPVLASVAVEATSVVRTGETALSVVAAEAGIELAPAELPSADVAPLVPRVLVPRPRRQTPVLVAAVLTAVVVLGSVVVPSALRARGDATVRRVPARQVTRSAGAIAPALVVRRGPPAADSAAVVPQGAPASVKPTSPAAVAGASARSAPVARNAARSAATASQVAEVPALPKIAAPVLNLPQAGGAPALTGAELVDARSRVSIAGEQADQGNYGAARQTLAGALARLDSAAARASDTESLRGVRREIEAAQKRTTAACGAESDLRRRHGQPPLSCP